jgi:hypothetical protein
VSHLLTHNAHSPVSPKSTFTNSITQTPYPESVPEKVQAEKVEKRKSSCTTPAKKAFQYSQQGHLEATYHQRE